MASLTVFLGAVFEVMADKESEVWTNLSCSVIKGDLLWGAVCLKIALFCLIYKLQRKFLPAGARAARERLVLRLLYVFRVCLFVCLFVCPHLSRAQNITSYVTMQLQCIAAFGGLRALDGESVVGSHKDLLVAYSY